MEIFGYKINATFGKLSGGKPTGFEISISNNRTIKYSEIDIHNDTFYY